MKLRQPLVRAQWKRVQQDDRLATPRLQVANRTVSQVATFVCICRLYRTSSSRHERALVQHRWLQSRIVG